MFLTNALLCLAMNIYHESRGEPLAGQLAVAQVTMNRAQGEAKNVCKVVLKPHQFSWTTRLVKKNHELVKKGLPKDEEAWAWAQLIARLALLDILPDITDGATYYHAARVCPEWSKVMNQVAIFGDHKFYVSNK